MVLVHRSNKKVTQDIEGKQENNDNNVRRLKTFHLWTLVNTFFQGIVI